MRGSDRRGVCRGTLGRDTGAVTTAETRLDRAAPARGMSAPSVRSFFLAVLLASLVPAVTASAAPAISAVEGNVSEGSVVSVRGSDFGEAGPVVILFDDYEKGKDGSPISTAPGSARVGQWSLALGDIRYSTDHAHSGAKAARSEWADAASGGIPQTQLNFPGSTRVFLSWWQYLPRDKDVPGTNNAERANWKLFWLWSDPFPGSDYLTVLLGPSSYAMAGDDTRPPARSHIPGYMRTHFARGKWMRYQLYFQGGQTDGAIEYAELSGSGLDTIVDAARLNTTRPGSSWNRLTMPGYGRQDANSQTYVDDVYVARGPGARARVELGDREAYAKCTRLALTTPLSWKSDRVTTTIRSGGFVENDAAYLFVIDSDGNASRGFPVTIGRAPAETAKRARPAESAEGRK